MFLCSVWRLSRILVLSLACFITFLCLYSAAKTTASMYYLLYALPTISTWKQWTNFNLRFEYQMYANWIRIRILKLKFENSNFVLHPYSQFYLHIPRLFSNGMNHASKPLMLRACLMWVSFRWIINIRSGPVSSVPLVINEWIAVTTLLKHFINQGNRLSLGCSRRPKLW